LVQLALISFTVYAGSVSHIVVNRHGKGLGRWNTMPTLFRKFTMSTSG
jgi:hypothetical protein